MISQKIKFGFEYMILLVAVFSLHKEHDGHRHSVEGYALYIGLMILVLGLFVLSVVSLCMGNEFVCSFFFFFFFW